MGFQISSATQMGFGPILGLAKGFDEDLEFKETTEGDNFGRGELPSMPRNSH